jgi:hypothetical protein
MTVSEARRYYKLEAENSKLKRLAATARAIILKYQTRTITFMGPRRV